MHVVHGCLVARPFLFQGVFDFGLSPLIALKLTFRDLARRLNAHSVALSIGGF
jgi:hypothetical protein